MTLGQFPETLYCGFITVFTCYACFSWASGAHNAAIVEVGLYFCIQSIWLKYEENLSSHRYVVAKERSTLMAFSDNCGYSLI